MDNMLDIMEQNQKTIENATSREEEEWFIYYGDQMAQIFAKYPEIATQDRLQDICDILNIDYIMLFDKRGKETLCNKEYSNFTLGTGQGENGSSFRRLLQGVDAIVQPTSYDETTSLNRQFIGVSLPDSSNVDPQGALIMALFPNTTSRTVANNSVNEQLQTLNSAGSMYFGVKADSGTIIESSESDYVGGSIFQFGLSEQSLKDGYMGFVRTEQTSYYAITSARGDLVYYYFMDSSSLFLDGLYFALTALACYLVMYIVLFLVMMAGIPRTCLSPVEESEEEASEEQKVKNFDLRRKKHLPWKEKNPKERATFVFKVMFVIFIALIAVYEFSNIGKSFSVGDSLFRFIFFGQWMRGLNLFSVCAIVMLMIGMYFINVLCKWILRSISSFFGKRGETIGRLLSSFSKYIFIILTVYFSLEYMGLQPGTILAGLGIAGLAVTMGAKDMITDIFAGISIVFEDAFQVGDIISIGSSRGTVEAIGIRMTRIKDISGTRIMNNREIKDVVNLTRESSKASITIKVSPNTDFEALRKLMESELPDIGKRNPDIIGTPAYLGVTGNVERSNLVNIMISADCLENKKFMVMNYLYEEVITLMNKEGYLID